MFGIFFALPRLENVKIILEKSRVILGSFVITLQESLVLLHTLLTTKSQPAEQVLVHSSCYI